MGELKNLNYRVEAIHLHMKQVAEFRREARCLDVSEIGISNLLSDTSHLASTVSNIYTHMYTHTHTHIIVTIEIEVVFFKDYLNIQLTCQVSFFVCVHFK